MHRTVSSKIGRRTETGLANPGRICIMQRMRRFVWLLLISVLGTSGGWASLADRVVIVANSNDRDSLKIARYYAEKRQVPAVNIVALPMPTVETINWREFVLTVWQPLQDELLKRGWIEGTAFKLYDEAGRRKVAVDGHAISYLVLCRGVPLRINNSPELLTIKQGREDPPELRTNQASVDAELSLLAYGPYNIKGFVHNPLFRVKEPSLLAEKMIVKVSRLDGPHYDDVIALINSTMEAEKTGLIGRGYVDVRGPHRQGEQWLELIATQIKELHFPSEVNREAGTFPASARFDLPALYFGWYAGNANGPFVLPDFRMAPGAIAVHIHSYSAATLRSASSGWCGPLVARGAAVTTGAVFEPYLQFMHYPHLLFEALAAGHNVGDAAYYALPSLSWQNVLIGDPLYQPRLHALDEQWQRRDQLAPRQRAYVALRKIQRLLDLDKPDEALAIGRAEQAKQPSLALGVRLAEILLNQDNATGAKQMLGFAVYLKSLRTNEWALLQRAGDLLAETGDAAAAVRIYSTLVAIAGVPNEIKTDWLKRGARLASAAGDMQQAMEWEREANKLIAMVETQK